MEVLVIKPYGSRYVGFDRANRGKVNIRWTDRTPAYSVMYEVLKEARRSMRWWYAWPYVALT